MTKATWNKEDCELLAKYMRANLSNIEIGKLMGRCPKAIGQKKFQLRQGYEGVTRSHRWTKEDCELLLKYREEGMASDDIAEKLGRTKNCIFSKVSDLRARGIIVAEPVPPVIIVEKLSKIDRTIKDIVIKRKGQSLVNDRFIQHDISYFYDGAISTKQLNKFKERIAKIPNIKIIPISETTGAVAYDFSEVRHANA